MVFRVDYSVVCFLRQCEQRARDKCLQALEFLFYNRSLGRNAVVGDMETFEALLDLPFSSATQHIIAYLLESFSTENAYKDFSSKILNIVGDLDASVSDFPISFVNIHIVEVLPETIWPQVLLVENDVDADVLKHFLRSYIRQVVQADCDCCAFESVLGGGSTTAKVFHRLLERENKSVYCVVDSDSLFPGSSIGATAKAAKAVERKFGGYGRLCLTVLECKELENLIPLTFFQDHIDLYPDREAFLKFIEGLPHKNRLYVDMKKGILMKPYVNYFNRDFDKTCTFMKVEFGFDLVEEMFCECIERDKCCKRCSKLFFAGFGDHALDNFLKQLDGHEQSFSFRDDDMNSVYKKLGESMFSWFLSAPSISS